MTDEQIKQLALACGFKLKLQETGEMDLNPYVYDFARELIATATQEQAIAYWHGYDDGQKDKKGEQGGI